MSTLKNFSFIGPAKRRTNDNYIDKVAINHKAVNPPLEDTKHHIETHYGISGAIIVRDLFWKRTMNPLKYCFKPKSLT